MDEQYPYSVNFCSLVCSKVTRTNSQSYITLDVTLSGYLYNVANIQQMNVDYNET